MLYVQTCWPMSCQKGFLNVPNGRCCICRCPEPTCQTDSRTQQVRFSLRLILHPSYAAHYNRSEASDHSWTAQLLKSKPMVRAGGGRRDQEADDILLVCHDVSAFFCWTLCSFRSTACTHACPCGSQFSCVTFGHTYPGWIHLLHLSWTYRPIAQPHIKNDAP